MKVRALMSHPAATCPTSANLADAARLMWEKDVGFVPVVAPDSGALVGVVTDRDVCMGALTKGRPLHEIPIGDVMVKNVRACGESDPVARAHSIMQDHQLRRLPVVDRDKRVVGVVAVNDLARHADATENKGMRNALIKTIGAVSQPRAGDEKKRRAPASGRSRRLA